MITQSLRLATLEDLPQMVRLGVIFHQSTQYAEILKVTDRAIESLGRQLLSQPNGAILVAETVDDGIVGMLGLATYIHPLTGECTASELFWWVAPGHRGSLGIRLLRMAEGWARNNGAAVIQMIAPDERVCRLYGRLGYSQVEITFHKRLDGADKE